MAGISVEHLVDEEGAPQVGVTVDGLDGGSTSVVTVEWSTDGRTWNAVRGALRAPVTGAGFFRDFIPPLNVETTYRLTVVSGLTIPADLTDTIVVPSQYAWMQDPLDPKTAVAVTTVRHDGGIALLKPSAGQITRHLPVDLAQVQGARLPVASIGVRQGPTDVLLHLRARAAAQGQLVTAMAELIETAGTVVLRGLPASIPIDPVAHVIAPDVRDSPIVGGLLGPRRDWVMSVTQVRAPSLRITVPWWTYDQVKALPEWVAATYDDVLAARPGATYLDWLRDPTGV